MDRKDFLKRGMLGTAAVVAASTGIAAITKNDNDELHPIETLGFNHIPNTESKIMENTILHKAATRGNANHGWLQSYHTFSFANYYNPERMHFGVLRVLNDDTVAPGMGFGTHPHDNMEIISIPLEGDLEHKDSMGNVAVIRNGDIQVMSAGTGITHSEYNKNSDKTVKFLQIWVFPNQRNVKPRYDQITLKKEDRKNKLQQILSPNVDDDGVWIHQNAWFNMGEFEKGITQNYDIKKAGDGLYIFVIDGVVKIDGHILNKRDAITVSDAEKVSVTSEENSKVLIIEVPMAW